MGQSRSSVLPKTGDDETRKARSLLVPRLMAAVGMLGLVVSFGLMAAFAPARAHVQSPPTGSGTLVSTTLIQRLLADSVRPELGRSR
jgi:hypothetical protein